MPIQHDFVFPVILVDDEPEILTLAQMTLQTEGINNIVTFQDSREVMPYLTGRRASVVVIDLMMPYVSGLELLKALVSQFPGLPVIVMTALDEVGTAVECLNTGAFDYLLKPVESGALISAVSKAMRLNSLQNEVSNLKSYLLSDRLDHAEAFADIITCSKKMRAIFQYTEVVAPSRQPILVCGETGTGKELIARAIHQMSRIEGEFVAVNVAGLDDAMFSDTLFGHRKGAFTGADQNREGLVSKAAGGTLFLDEIGDLTPLSQVKLLRLLQEGEYYPLGSDIVKSSNARVIVATNQNLENLMKEGKFRKDLYYRLSTYLITLPPLRERTEDIPLLLDHFLEQAVKAFNKPKPVPSPEVAELLASLNLPGNIRELQAIIFDAVARHKSGMLNFRHFPTIQQAMPRPRGPAAANSLDDVDHLFALFGRFPSIDEMEEYLIGRALKMAAGKAGAAAALLGISRQGLHKRMKQVNSA